MYTAQQYVPQQVTTYYRPSQLDMTEIMNSIMPIMMMAMMFSMIVPMFKGMTKDTA
ncbi:MAG: hypothetical protein PHQ43_09505 [Dehalococcoidales bacterium]|nr:hypothetical protein [Dehalococcoidales bacterium]